MARRSDAYATRHPEPGDVLLGIEVADSSLRQDRLEKAAITMSTRGRPR